MGAEDGSTDAEEPLNEAQRRRLVAELGDDPARGRATSPARRHAVITGDGAPLFGAPGARLLRAGVKVGRPRHGHPRT